ncbi:MAG TPA: hypothetical protein VGR56_08330 [Nitrososphaerales archaeon]|nr:hypothetical protein [Nitrososphaerales archaeon]
MEPESSAVVSKASVSELTETISRKNPSTLSFELGKRNYYDNGAISKYLAYPHFQYVLFNDSNGASRGLMKAHDFKSLHSIPGFNTAHEVETGHITSNDKIVPAIREGASNKEALQLMDTEHTDTLNVVDATGRHRGVVTREGIVSKLMTKMLTG